MENDEKGGKRQGVDPTTAAQQHSKPIGLKRRINWDDTIADTIAPSSEMRLVFPTEQTQKLYNDWRRQLDKEYDLQQSVGRLPSGPVSLLRVPTMPLPPLSPPATQGAVFGDSSQIKGRHRGRQEPLTNSGALKMALARKLGACSGCSRRRAKCDHFDFTAFELGYQATKRPNTGSLLALGGPAAGSDSNRPDLLPEQDTPRRELKDDEGQTPLSLAARGGLKSVVEKLLERGAEIESRDDEGQTLLSWATRKGHGAVVSLLLDKGAEIESRDNKGRTPLLWAAREGYESIVRLLLDKGAEVDSRDHECQTPLFWAARRNHEAIVGILLDQGGSPWQPAEPGSIVQLTRVETNSTPSLNPSDNGQPDYEMPFTDSGYASAPLGDPGLNSTVAGASGKKNSDSETVISAGTTIAEAVAQNSISEICNDIYARLQCHVGADNQNLLFDVVPDLIKAFALRLDQADPSHASWNIMHFVYSRHSDVTFQLRQLFQIQSQSEDEDVSCRDSKGGLSLAEKMEMWASRPQDLDTTAAASERFQAVSDDPDYGRVILQSKAYEWFIQRLLKESSFYWGHGSPMRMMHKIRHDVLSSLLASRISKGPDPDIHQAEFIMPSLRLRQRLLWESRNLATSAWGWNHLSAVAVLVGSPDDCLLATTVGEYIDQTWGDNRELLREFQTELGRVLDPGISKRVEGGSAPSVPSLLHVFIQGVSTSIAEQGEQLAWLLAALQDPESKAPILSRSSITKISVENTWGIFPESARGSIGNTDNLSILKTLGWFGTLIAPVIAQGFPTIRRPPSARFGKGIEISPNLLTHLFTPISGGSAVELVDEKQGVCLWHAGGCQCRRAQGPQIPSLDIQQYRHIVDICPGTSGLESEPSPALRTDDLDTRDSPPVAGSVATLEAQDSSSDCPETSLESEMMSIPDSPDAPTYGIPAELSRVIDAVASRLLQEFKDGAYHAFPEAGMTPPWERSQSPPSDPAAGLGVASARTRPEQGDAGQDYDGSGRVVLYPSNATRNETRPQIFQASRKRAGPDEKEDEDGNEGPGNAQPPPKKLRRELSFACPFLIFDPVRHHDCLKSDKLWEVNRVKQHLARRHYQPVLFCDRCKAIFQNRHEHRRHLQEDNATCTYKSWDSGDFLIDQTQQRELSKRSKSALEPERWFAVWNILFPDHPRPPSPYYIDVGSSDLRLFREYARGRGRALLRQELQAAEIREPGVSLSEEAQESYTLSAIHQALDSMIQGFLLSVPSLNRPLPRSSGNRGSGRSELSGRDTSSYADSGVALTSNQGLGPQGHRGFSLAVPADLEPQPFFGQNQVFPNIRVAAQNTTTPRGAFQQGDGIGNAEDLFSGLSGEGIAVQSRTLPAHGGLDGNEMDSPRALNEPENTFVCDGLNLGSGSGLTLPLDFDWATFLEGTDV